MKNAIKIIICLVFIAIFTVGCTATATAAGAKQERLYLKDTITLYGWNYAVIVDSETGVEYLSSGRGGVTPILNSDGTIKTVEVEE